VFKIVETASPEAYKRIESFGNDEEREALVIKTLEEDGCVAVVDEDSGDIIHRKVSSGIRADTVERAFWTREDADRWCKANSASDGEEYYSYSVPASGILRSVIELTCKREIERNEARKSK
jgi:hypothetical protein